MSNWKQGDFAYTVSEMFKACNIGQDWRFLEKKSEGDTVLNIYEEDALEPFVEIWLDEGEPTKSKVYEAVEFYDPDSGTDVDWRELNDWMHIADSVLLVVRMYYENAVSDVFTQNCPNVYEEFADIYEENEPENSLCPHGKEFHECNSCMTMADFYSDVARENKLFGR